MSCWTRIHSPGGPTPDERNSVIHFGFAVAISRRGDAKRVNYEFQYELRSAGSSQAVK